MGYAASWSRRVDCKSPGVHATRWVVALAVVAARICISSYSLSFYAHAVPPRGATRQNRLCESGSTCRSSARRRGKKTRQLSLAAILPSSAGFHIPRKLLLVMFILVDTGQAFVMDWAEKRDWDPNRTGSQYARQTVLVFESGLAIVIGAAFAWASGGAAAVRGCFDLHQFLKFLPVSLCFALGLSLKMMAVNHFQAGTLKIFGQLRLPLLTVLSALLLAKRYSLVQWQVISLITTSCLAFVVLKGQGRVREGKRWKSTGLLQMIGWVIFNVSGGIAAEHAYKSGALPFYAQKVSEDLGYLLISSLMMLIVVPRFDGKENILDRKLRPKGFFDSWDLRTVMVVVFLLLDAFVGNLLLKEFSVVTKSVAKAFCVAIVYFASLTYAKERRNNAALTWVALMVIQSSLLYAFVS